MKSPMQENEMEIFSVITSELAHRKALKRSANEYKINNIFYFSSI